MWITGQVVDDHGHALADATIEVKGFGAGRRRTAVTNSAGQYVLQDLRPGVYTLTFGHSGFYTLERTTEALTTYVATINAHLQRQVAPG